VKNRAEEASDHEIRGGDKSVNTLLRLLSEAAFWLRLRYGALLLAGNHWHFESGYRDR
jgi:hypothetical protein